MTTRHRGFAAKWVILILLVIGGLLCATGTILYTFNVTPQYRASATLMTGQDEFSGRDPQLVLAENESKLRRQAAIAGSVSLISAVSERLKGEDRKVFMEPYAEVMSLSGPLTVEEVVHRNRSVEALPESGLLIIHYTHPHPVMAAKVANLFADELINFDVKLNIETSMRAVEDLRIRADHQREKVAEMRERLLALDGQNAIEIDLAKEEYDVNKTLYVAMMGRLQTEMAEVALTGPSLRVLDKAAAPMQPFKPNILLNVAIGVGAPFAVVLLFTIVAVLLD